MPVLTHDDIDIRLLRLHGVVAERLRADPGLVAVARATLARWMERGVAPEALRKWARLIEGPREQLLSALVADTPAMRELRQSSPFAGTAFMDNSVRWKMLDESRRL